jgi:hypothetical protein
MRHCQQQAQAPTLDLLLLQAQVCPLSCWQQHSWTVAALLLLLLVGEAMAAGAAVAATPGVIMELWQQCRAA